jgi:enoyl-CoA hydratase
MIRVRREGPVATIALARPEAKNAIPIGGWQAIAAAAVEVRDARVVILQSDAPGIFSAGADIGEFERIRAEPRLRTVFHKVMRRGIEAIAGLPMPVIAAIDGGCFGAAVALALAADIRIAGDDAEFAITPARLGLGYPQEDVARVVAQVGRGIAAVMLFTGGKMQADEAERIGLAELRADDAGETARTFAATIAANAPGSLAQLKRALNGPAPDLGQAFEDAFGGAELAEGLAAFRERRRPVF